MNAFRQFLMVLVALALLGLPVAACSNGSSGDLSLNPGGCVDDEDEPGDIDDNDEEDGDDDDDAGECEDDD